MHFVNRKWNAMFELTVVRAACSARMPVGSICREQEEKTSREMAEEKDRYPQMAPVFEEVSKRFTPNQRSSAMQRSQACGRA